MNRRPSVLFLCMLLLTACGSFLPNSRLRQYEPNRGYRFNQLENDDEADKLFVIVTFSGGGTRAAALAYGVLEGLEKATVTGQSGTVSLLDEIDVISSVSGGSFTAAYYGLHGRKLFSDFKARFLYRPIESELLSELWSPANLFKLGGSSYGRSDLVAEYYDREVFDGATYANLIAKGTRPFIVLNATDMTIGSQFSFVQDQFDLLCSDLAGVPIARAAASSSAFPGLLTPLTFENYAGSCGYKQPRWVELAMKDRRDRVNPRRTGRAEERLSYTKQGEARRDYIHLIDGGVADNIGLRDPLAAITSTNQSWSVLRFLNQKRVDRLVVIVVNAATDPVTKRDKTPDVPGLIDVLTTAATVPLDNYSFDTLELLESKVKEFNDARRLVEGCKNLASRADPPCPLNIPEPHHVEFYTIHVDFDRLCPTEGRDWYKNLSTNFQLPEKTVDSLINIGQYLLYTDRDFRCLINGQPAGCKEFALPKCNGNT